MLSCEDSQLLIADVLYTDLTPDRHALLREHLEDCGACRELLHDLQESKTCLEMRGVAGGNYDDIPERAALDTLWDKLQPQLDSIDADRARHQARYNIKPYLGIATALAASVIVFFSVLPTTTEQSAPAGEVSQSSSVNPELMRYLSRVETMLMSVANAETTSTDNAALVPVQQNFARDMAMQANFMTNNLDDSFNSGQSRLLQDIEFMLLQIANLDESNMEEGVRLLQQYMEQNSVLLKIRLMEMRNQQDAI